MLRAILSIPENGCKWRSLPSYLLKEQLSVLKSEMIKAEIEKAKPKEESKPVAAFPSSESAGKLKWRKYFEEMAAKAERLAEEMTEAE